MDFNHGPAESFDLTCLPPPQWVGLLWSVFQVLLLHSIMAPFKIWLPPSLLTLLSLWSLKFSQDLYSIFILLNLLATWTLSITLCSWTSYYNWALAMSYSVSLLVSLTDLSESVSVGRHAFFSWCLREQPGLLCLAPFSSYFAPYLLQILQTRKTSTTISWLMISNQFHHPWPVFFCLILHLIKSPHISSWISYSVKLKMAKWDTLYLHLSHFPSPSLNADATTIFLIVQVCSRGKYCLLLLLLYYVH